MLTYEICLPEQRDILEYLINLIEYQSVPFMDFRINGQWVEFYRTVNPWFPDAEPTYHVKWKWKSGSRDHARFYEAMGTLDEMRKCLLWSEDTPVAFRPKEEQKHRYKEL